MLESNVRSWKNVIWWCSNCIGILVWIILFIKIICERFICILIWFSYKFKMGRCIKIKEWRNRFYVCDSLFFLFKVRKIVYGIIY